jgi:hypothetical protein
LTVATATNYTTVISLLKTFGEANVLSRPRITVADREEAKILVGSKEVYVTSEVTTTSGGTYHTTDHVEFADVGVALTVVPEINRAGFIKLKIKPEVSSSDDTKTVRLENPDGSTRTIVPFVSTSEAETTVLIKDRTTLVIGGLMKDEIVEYKDKVPFLGDLPLLGGLFSTKGKSKEKTELVILLTPRIIEGDTFTEEAERYLGEWDDKKEDAAVKKPKEPTTAPPKAVKKYKKSITKAKPRVRAARDEKSEWQPIFTPEAEERVLEEMQEARRKQSFAAPDMTPYEGYRLALEEEIMSVAARQDVSGLEGEVEVQFVLDSEGFITRGPTVLNKPDLYLVRKAVNCVKEASPFPPFSKGMNKDDTEFIVVVRYE